MESIIGPVLGSASEHVDCHRNFQDDVDDLRKRVADLKRRRNDKEAELQTVNALRKKVKEEVQGWLEDARRVIEIEMPDIEEQVQNVSYLSRGNLGRRVRQKIQEVREIYDRGTFPEGLVIERPLTTGIPLPTGNMVGEVDVKEKIREYLRGHEVGIIGVCGVGGVGKTTVMKHIHNELLKEATRFTKIVIWVTVSHPLNVFKLQGDIASALNESLSDYGDELNRASRLMEVMKTVKYTLILDDVWDKFTLQRVGIPEPTVENGCKIVITSRSVDVCNYLRCQIVKVPPLSENESLNLFLDRVGRDILRIPNLEDTLKRMVAECAGLPLAIVVIAGSMRGVEDIFDWRNALRELRQCVVDTEKDSEDEIFNRLKFSYDRLPNSNIQNCFLYCSLYPEDWEIEREDLIEKWICEGLVDKLGSRREMHDKGNSILNRLLNHCLLEKANREACVKMHDVVRDMALRIKSTGPARFMVKAKMGLTKMPDDDEWNADLDKVSLMENEISCIPIDMSPKCLMLSTLILKGNYELRQIPECFFANMPLLKFLDLSNTGIEALPNSVCSLKNLTTLILRGCWHIERLPSLSKLKALKKLDLAGTRLGEAPEGIEMLENLEYLDLSSPKLRYLPEGKISKLFRLQYLRKHLIFENEIRGEEIARLEMLECFEGRFIRPQDFNSFVSKLNHFGMPNNYWLQMVRGFNEQKADEQGHFWKFINNGPIKQVTLSRSWIGEASELVLPDDLWDLRIGCWRTDAMLVPTISPRIFSNLKQLRLWHCSELKKLFSCELLQGQGLQNLEEIVVQYCSGMEEIIGWEKEEANQTIATAKFTLPKLSRLSLFDLPQLKRIYPERGVIVCDSLNSIEISKCSKLKKMFPCELLQGQGLQNLEKIYVRDCLGMEEIIGWEEEEEGNQATATAKFTLPKLSNLSLCGLPQLKRIYPERGVMVCDSLKSIYILHCSKLKKLFPCELLQGQGLQNLEQIKVIDCQQMEEIMGWEEEEEGNQTTATAKFTLPKLIKLSLNYLPQLKRICPERGVMVCDSLNSISICCCEKVKRIPLCLGRKNGQPFFLAIKVSIYNPKEWWESVEWENPDDKNVLLPFLQYKEGDPWVEINYGSV